MNGTKTAGTLAASIHTSSLLAKPAAAALVRTYLLVLKAAAVDQSPCLEPAVEQAATQGLWS